MSTKVRQTPCKFCPYRRDVPSGVWDRTEYAKLEEYDLDTGSQPMKLFNCHESNGMLCCGWAQCHGYELLALRLLEFTSKSPVEIPPITTPIFASVKEAAEHGMARIKNPSAKAVKAMAYIGVKRSKKK